MDYPWAVVGAKVVCINDVAPEGTRWFENDQPTIGHVYTITEVFVQILTDEVGFKLAEIERGPIAKHQGKIGYGAYRFKPLEKKKLPAVLTELLINPRKKIEKDAFDKELV